jgi:hypothetical protein
MATIGRAFVIYREEFFATVTSQYVANARFTLGSGSMGSRTSSAHALDFLCVIEISNRGGAQEFVADDSQTAREWAVPPPQRIPPNGAGRFWLRDPKPSLYGSEGSATYPWVDSSGSRQPSSFSFADPTSGLNAAASSSSAFAFYTKSGGMNSAWSASRLRRHDGSSLLRRVRLGFRPASATMPRFRSASLLDSKLKGAHGTAPAFM